MWQEKMLFCAVWSNTISDTHLNPSETSQTGIESELQSIHAIPQGTRFQAIPLPKDEMRNNQVKLYAT